MVSTVLPLPLTPGRQTIQTARQSQRQHPSVRGIPDTSKMCCTHRQNLVYSVLSLIPLTMYYPISVSLFSTSAGHGPLRPIVGHHSDVLVSHYSSTRQAGRVLHIHLWGHEVQTNPKQLPSKEAPPLPPPRGARLTHFLCGYCTWYPWPGMDMLYGVRGSSNEVRNAPLLEPRVSNSRAESREAKRSVQFLVSESRRGRGHGLSAWTIRIRRDEISSNG